MGTMEVVPMPYAKDGRKTCSACRADLPVSEFNRNRRSKDGLQNQCADCLNASRRDHRRRLGRCSIDRCSTKAVAGRLDAALCGAHYKRRQLGQDMSTPIRPLRAKGEGSINAQGYLVRMVNGRNGLEHRRVMEEVLGRPLRADETVHHRNSQRADNRPENLELWVGIGSQPKGSRAADLLVWAREIVARYEPIEDKL